jgi:site-specific DNA recombinase
MGDQIHRAVVYCRVSTEEQAASGTSLETQKLACLRKAAEIDSAVHGSYVDEGVSGAFYDTRPGLQAALAAVEAKQASLLIVYSVSRLSRDVEHQQAIKKRITRAGGRMIICDMPVEDTPEGELMYGIGGTFAQYERRLILARTLLGHRRRAQEGLQPYRQRAPFGYFVPQASYSVKEWDAERGKEVRRRYPTGASADEIGRYLVKEEEARWVCEIFARYSAGHSLRKIAAWLDENGVQTPKGGVRWHPQTLCVILQNPTYRGAAAVGRTESLQDESRVTVGKPDRTGRVRPLKGAGYRTAKTPDTWITVPCPALVDVDTWERCQGRLRENQAILSGNPRRRYLLSGLVRCPVCDGRAAGEMNRGKYPLYSCRRHTSYSTSATRLESAVLEIMERGLSCPESIAAAFEAYRLEQEQDRTTVDTEALRYDMNELLDRETKTARAQVDALIAGRSTEVYDRLLAEVDSERKAVQAKLDDAATADAAKPSPSEAVPTVTEALQALRTVLTCPTITTAERNEAVAGFVQEVVPGEDLVTVHFRPFTAGGESVQSATKMFVSWGSLPWRLEAQTRRLPSGLNIGKASNWSPYVMRSRPVPSMPIT